MKQIKTLQIYEEEYKQLLELKQTKKFHNLSEVVRFLLNGQKENITLTKRLDALEQEMIKVIKSLKIN